VGLGLGGWGVRWRWRCAGERCCWLYDCLEAGGDGLLCVVVCRAGGTSTGGVPEATEDTVGVRRWRVLVVGVFGDTRRWDVAEGALVVTRRGMG